MLFKEKKEHRLYVTVTSRDDFTHLYAPRCQNATEESYHSPAGYSELHDGRSMHVERRQRTAMHRKDLQDMCFETAKKIAVVTSPGSPLNDHGIHNGEAPL